MSAQEDIEAVWEQLVEGQRQRVSLTTRDLELVTKLADVQRTLSTIADALANTRRGSKQHERRDIAQALVVMASELKTVEMEIANEL